MLEIKKYVDQVLAWMVIVLMAVMSLDVLWQVFTRFIMGDPSPWTEELARFTLIWVGLLGAAYVAGQKMHLALDLLPMKLEGNSKIYLDLFIQSSIFIFALVVMVIGGINLVYLMLLFEQASAALGVKLGHVYIVVPMSGLLIMFYSAVFITAEIQTLRDRSDAVPTND
jgi:TRAP-type C4-dicarboxylate transport system permease small subunit